MQRLFVSAHDFYLELYRKMLYGVSNLLQIEDLQVDTTPKEVVYQEDIVKLYHYKPRVPNSKLCPIPILIVYALVNRYYMLDIQPDRSIIRKLLDLGMDIYLIDWGYPDKSYMYFTMDDYINGYLNNCVNFIRKEKGIDKINLLGICQGGTFSAIYTALHQEKVKNLIVMVAPFDFDTKDGLLNVWAKHLPIDLLADGFRVIPGDYLNIGFLLLKPFSLMIDKYVGFLENVDKKETLESFLRMEKWIFDSPDQAGETWRQFLKDLYQENKLIKGELVIGNPVEGYKKVDLRKIEVPILNIYGEYDHLVPPVCSIPFNDIVSSKDKTLISFKTGHIGMYVSSRTQKDLPPTIANWVWERSVDKPKLAAKAAEGKGKAKKGQ